MAGELQLGGSTVATHTGSGASAVVTIDNGVKFPSGHIIQTVTAQYVIPSAITITTTEDDYLGSNLQCTITPTANGNKLYIQAFIEGVYNHATYGRGLHAGFAYDTDFSSSNGTIIGPRSVISSYTSYINQNHQVLDNSHYFIVVTVGTQAPSAGSASIIRPRFKAQNGDVQIGANTSAGYGVCSMMVMEIQA